MKVIVSVAKCHCAWYSTYNGVGRVVPSMPAAKM